MKKIIVITDLTQMRAGNRVCIAGIDDTGQCLRPVSDSREEGIPESLLYYKKQLIIRPGAKVEFDFHNVPIEPPHIEDRGFNSNHIISKGFCGNSEWEGVLSKNSYEELRVGYDGLLQNNRWIQPGAQTKSLITLSKPKIQRIELSSFPRNRKTEGIIC